MFCAHLSLVNFRNYTRLELDLPPGVVVLVGDNAQGKSNLLEALYFLATTKSFRATSDRDLINWRALGGELCYARLTARVNRRPSHVKVEALINGVTDAKQPSSASAQAPPVSKRLKLNDVPKRAIDFIGAVNVVMFSPLDIELVDGPPTVRRRYLDITISQVDSRYVRSLSHYSKVVVQRNHLLRQIRERKARPEQLALWDEELVKAGSQVIQRRHSTVRILCDLARDYHRQLTGRLESLEVTYRPNVNLANVSAVDGIDGDLPIEDFQTAFSQQLRSIRGREIEAGVSCLGPHRDDLAFMVDSRSMNTFGSRGQQRTVALALKMAEAEFLRRSSGEQPILLLDDVLSELDESRRSHLLSSIAEDQQVIVTATDLDNYTTGFLARATVCRVVEGAIGETGLARVAEGRIEGYGERAV